MGRAQKQVPPPWVMAQGGEDSVLGLCTNVLLQARASGRCLYGSSVPGLLLRGEPVLPGVRLCGAASARFHFAGGTGGRRCPPLPAAAVELVWAVVVVVVVDVVVWCRVVKLVVVVVSVVKWCRAGESVGRCV